jgi:hypothetical protein
MRSNYWYSREMQKKAYRRHLIKAYAPLVAVLALTVVVALL